MQKWGDKFITKLQWADDKVGGEMGCTALVLSIYNNNNGENARPIVCHSNCIYLVVSFPSYPLFVTCLLRL